MVRALTLWLVAGSCLASCSDSESTGPTPSPPFRLELIAGGLEDGCGQADGIGEAARFRYGLSVAVDVSGTLFVADPENGAVRRVAADGVVTTLASATGDVRDIAVDGAGLVYVNAAGVIRAIASDGTITDVSDELRDVRNVAVDSAGVIFAARGKSLVRLAPAGTLTVLAGQRNESGDMDGVGGAARFSSIEGIAVDSGGVVYVIDGLRVRRVAGDGTVTTLASAVFPSRLAVDGVGNVYVSDAINYTIHRISPTGEVTTIAGAAGMQGTSDGLSSGAQFAHPYGIASDASGTLFVGDGCRIRRITPGLAVETVAGRPQRDGSADGYGAAARFGNPTGVAIGTDGTIVVAEHMNRGRNGRVRRIATDGAVSTLEVFGGGDTTAPFDVAIDRENNAHVARGRLFLAPDPPEIAIATDKEGSVYFANYRDEIDRPGGISRYVTKGLTTLAGPGEGCVDGRGREARFGAFSGLAADGAGTIFVADSCGLRATATDGQVTTPFPYSALPALARLRSE